MKIRRFIALLLAVLMLLPLVSCGDGKDDGKDDGTVENDGIAYKVTVQDPFGNPISGMVVTVYDKNGDEADTRLTGKTGIAAAKNPLASGEYTVEVTDTDGKKLYYDESVCKLSEGKEEITVVLYKSLEDNPTDTLYVRDTVGDNGTPAPIISDGGYALELVKGDNYFVFTPSQRGKYTVAAESSASILVGYYGSPHFVQTSDLSSNDGSGEVYKTEGGICFNIRQYNVGEGYGASSRYVVMIESDAAATCFIRISCDPDLPLNKEELPWTEYSLETEPDEYTVVGKDAEGFALTDVDITSENLTIVYNSADKLYHVGSLDGPILLVRMTSGSKYLPSFSTIMETASFLAYVYDDEGNLLEKANYHTMMSQYCAAADDDLGVIPLTSDILEAITNYGRANGWFDLASANSIFVEDAPLAKEALAVYFACCYVAE